jgi:hypothetical protein
MESDREMSGSITRRMDVDAGLGPFIDLSSIVSAGLVAKSRRLGADRGVVIDALPYR